MKKAEQNLWRTFRARCKRSDVVAERVENIAINGMPDVHIKSTGKWVELKAPVAPQRESTRLLGSAGLSVDQINWHMEAYYVGRRTYILIRDSLRRLFLIEGKYAKDINNWTAETLRTYSVATTWETIMEFLK